MERTTWKARNCIDPFLILPLFMIATLPAFIVYMHAGNSPYSNLIFFVPMVLLGEIGIFFGRRNEKKEKSKKRARWFWQEPTCKFCGARLSTSLFCPKCGRARR
jgi:hypothetical protein